MLKLTKSSHKVLAALLHLGNIKYKSTSEKNMEASSIPDLTNVERVAAILGLTKNALLQVGLLKALILLQIIWADQ